METNRVANTSSPGWLQTQGTNEGGENRGNNNPPNRPGINHTPSEVKMSGYGISIDLFM